MGHEFIHVQQMPPTTISTSSCSSQKIPPPPQPEIILISYLVLGTIAAFVFGRDSLLQQPGISTTYLLLELAPTLIVIAVFLVSYSVYDVMGVGIAKLKTGYNITGTYKDTMERATPEEVYLAQRVQTNQLEQMPNFIFGGISCAVFLNGTVAVILSMIWVILRRRYATVYRNAVGIPFDKIGLTKYTIPAYFVSNIMLISSAVQAARLLAKSYL